MRQTNMNRSQNFVNNQNFTDRRRRWFDVFGSYVPIIFSFLTDEEWDLIEEWYTETEEKHFIGEASVPFMSLLHGLIMGNKIQRIVQLGHYAGFSSLLIGFMLRKMDCKNGLFSIDIDPIVSEFTDAWIKKAGLQDYVSVNISDSAAPDMPQKAEEYLKGNIELVIIDSSHQYRHTKQELDLWFPKLKKTGIIAMHDISEFATDFDSTGEGGVEKALNEWESSEPNASILRLLPQDLPKDVLLQQDHVFDRVYRDPCGIALIQKR